MKKMEMKVNKQEVREKSRKALVRVGKFINDHYAVILMCVILVMMTTTTVYGAAADPDGADKAAATATSDTAEKMWTELTSLITTWVTRLGGAVIFVGGIMFGLGWKSDDAEQKSRGLSTVIAGAIVASIAGIASTFF